MIHRSSGDDLATTASGTGYSRAMPLLHLLAQPCLEGRFLGLLDDVLFPVPPVAPEREKGVSKPLPPLVGRFRPALPLHFQETAVKSLPGKDKLPDLSRADMLDPSFPAADPILDGRSTGRSTAAPDFSCSSSQRKKRRYSLQSRNGQISSQGQAVIRTGATS
jgi:hypothetical protein